MKKEIIPTIISGPHKDFESIKQIDENGVEFWLARDLMTVLGYATWRRFEEVIDRAKKACANSQQISSDHFAGAGKMVSIGSNTARRLEDYKLDRYACYMIAQNGDPRKPVIAQAQTYFAVQTRKQELADTLPNMEKRIAIRNEVTKQNKKLFSTAKTAGVSNFGSFNDAGYRGLYDLSLSEIEKRKGIKKGELFDRAGGAELAANLFRITQTEEKIKNDKIRGESKANEVHSMISRKVRQTIKDIGGTLPENLKPEKHIKEVKRNVRVAKRGMKKLKANK